MKTSWCKAFGVTAAGGSTGHCTERVQEIDFQNKLVGTRQLYMHMYEKRLANTPRRPCSGDSRGGIGQPGLLFHLSVSSVPPPSIRH